MSTIRGFETCIFLQVLLHSYKSVGSSSNQGEARLAPAILHSANGVSSLLDGAYEKRIDSTSAYGKHEAAAAR